jgi:nucleotide-binding universal stress UspA family protein
MSSEVLLVQVEPTLTQLVAQTMSPELPSVSADVAQREREALLASGTRYLSGVASQLSQQGIKASGEVVEGTPGAAILDYAEKHGVSLIAMSTHGRGGLGRLVYGSVANSVLSHSHVPLLLVRQTE